jgi:hypothetical protein
MAENLLSSSNPPSSQIMPRKLRNEVEKKEAEMKRDKRTMGEEPGFTG